MGMTGQQVPRYARKAYRGAPTTPPAQMRVVPIYSDEDLIAAAQREYIAGRIDADELEAAIEHILNGGLGFERFPYLPVFPAPVWLSR